MENNEEMKNAMLPDNQLEEITGGTVTIGNCRFTGHVGQYNGVVGRKYYVVKDDGSQWFYGKLIKTHDVMFAIRVHIIECTLKNGAPYNRIEQVGGSDYSLYTSMTRI